MVACGGCEKKAPSSIPTEKIATAEAIAAPAVASHLGFATRVPKDADVFLAGYGADEMVAGLMEKLGDFQPPGLVRDPADRERERENVREALPYVGDEMFLFVGRGAGEQLGMIGTTYRELSAAWAGFAVGKILDTMANEDVGAGLAGLEEGLSNDLLNKWLDVIEKDSRLEIPSVVLGWKPGSERLTECHEAVARSLAESFATREGATPLDFEAHGMALAGFELSGRAAFGEAIAKARAELAEKTPEMMERIPPERIERVLDALENVRLTVAAGVVDGRVLIYLGNGREGFRLAGTPAESLAATADLQWTGEFTGKRIAGMAYLSRAVVSAGLPWLDSSAYWNAFSGSIRPPIREQRLFRELLTGLAGTERALAMRDATAWSALAMGDDGWRIETRGGWPDPSLDYETPLTMTSATATLKPAISAHWIQRRERKDLAWKQLEYYGALLDATFGEVQTASPAATAMLPEGAAPRLMDEVRKINRAYREEFRAGIGDEVAFAADFQGEVPALPGLSEDTVRTAKAPRFLLARPVTDRAMIDAAGKSFTQSWRDLTLWAGELFGSDLPLILPQSVDSNDLVTWYPPLPFIGGDFLPGVTMNDRLWMLGTSRSMVGGFAKAMQSASSGGETGMIVEIDFAPIRDWLADLYQRNEAAADQLATQAPDEMRALADKQNREKLAASARHLQGLSYRKWMADGSPRTSLHVRFGAVE